MIKTRYGRTTLPVIMAASLLLSACDAGSVVMWPWVEPADQGSAEPEPGDGGAPPPPPPLDPVDPLHPSEPGEAEVVPNPNANTGAPGGDTPFVEQPETATPISDDTPPVSAETGQPVVIPPPSDPSPSGPSEPAPAPEPSAPVTPAFFYFPPASLEPGSGTGSTSSDVFVTDMAFPIRLAPSHPQSQVYRYGGGVKGGDQCDARNFTAPWRDNYCESRSTTTKTAFCGKTGVHTGQDIRVGTPEGCAAERSAKAADRTRYEVVAAEDGVISNVGSYSISLRANGSGRIHRYLHLNMAKLKVATGQSVKKGDVIGYVSNDFGGTPTTLHLHYEIKVNTAEHGWQWVPPYSSLLAAYQRREDNPGEMVATNAGVASAPR
jgi:murein DD-endopeptidase MepM/ murein hydrolase activator NlpD